jgi:hypothetical protein
MHLMRVFRGVCLEIIYRDDDKTFKASDLVDPSKPNAFSALERVYKVAKELLKQYGNVRIFNAEKCHRRKGKVFSFHNTLSVKPDAGYENDPRSAVYIATSKGNVSASCASCCLHTTIFSLLIHV